MIQLPHMRAGSLRGGGSVTPVSVVRTATANLSTTITFAAAATSGQLVVLTAVRGVFSTALTAPTGFTEICNFNSGGVSIGRWAAWYKVAGGSESASYTVESTWRCNGYILDNVGATPIGEVSTNPSGATVTSLDCASTPIDANEGALLIAMMGRAAGGITATFDNSFGSVITNAARMNTAHRSYTTAATSQNTTASWTGAVNSLGAALFEVLPA